MGTYLVPACYTTREASECHMTDTHTHRGFTDCPVPKSLQRADPGYTQYYCGDGVERFFVAGACVLVYLLALLAHCCPWVCCTSGKIRQHNAEQRRRLELFRDGNYAPGKEVCVFG